MRILHLADLHLGWQPTFLGNKNEERKKERDSILQRAVDLALDSKNGIDALVIAGDLFETHTPSSSLVDTVIAELSRLDRAGKRIITVPGNHDEITYSDSVYKKEAARWPGILALNPNLAEIACFEQNGEKTAFYGLAYTAGVTKTTPPLADFPKREAQRHVGVFHGSLDWDTGDRSLPISGEAAAFSGYHCLALGHLHKHVVRHLGPVTACYAGAVEAKGFSDPGTGFFTVLELNRQTKVETVSTDCRPCLVHTLDLSLCDGLNDVVTQIKVLANQRAITKVIFTGLLNFQLEAEKLVQQFAHLFYHLEVESEGVFLDESLISSLQEEPTIRGYFVRNMQKRLHAAKEEEEREILRRALYRGVAALRGGVS